jgi:hypothetical protein
MKLEPLEFSFGTTCPCTLIYARMPLLGGFAIFGKNPEAELEDALASTSPFIWLSLSLRFELGRMPFAGKD